MYIHDVWAGGSSVNEQLDRLNMSSDANNYTILVGFSWDSNTALNPYGWGIAKYIADQNGPKLAQFIFDFHNNARAPIFDSSTMTSAIFFV